MASVVAEWIANGSVVGWVQGRSEFGPRALGNRSIVADPRPAKNKDRINAIVKNARATGRLHLPYWRNMPLSFSIFLRPRELFRS